MVELECTACGDRKGKAIEIKRKTKAVQFIFKHTYRGYPLLLEYLHSNNNRYSNRNYEKSPTNTKQLCAILQINFDCGRAFVGGVGVEEGEQALLSMQRRIWCSSSCTLYSFSNYNICFLAFLPFATHDIYKCQRFRTVGSKEC